MANKNESEDVIGRVTRIMGEDLLRGLGGDFLDFWIGDSGTQSGGLPPARSPPLRRLGGFWICFERVAGTLSGGLLTEQLLSGFRHATSVGLGDE